MATARKPTGGRRPTSDEDLDFAREVGQRVRRLREARGWTLTELAKRGDIAKMTLSLLERGASNANLSTVRRLAAAFKCSIGNLLTGQKR